MVKPIKQRIEEVIDSYNSGETFFTRDFKEEHTIAWVNIHPVTTPLGSFESYPKVVRIGKQTEAI